MSFRWEDFADSDTANGRVEENTAREVGVTPLSEGRLLLEILFDCREVLLVQDVMVALISGSEVFVVMVLA